MENTRAEVSDHKAIYAVTYDPWTAGHSHVLAQAAPLFSEIVLAIGINPLKKPMFSIDKRLEFLYDVAREYSNVTVDTFEGVYLISYADAKGADYIIRGLRNSEDFEYELSLAQLNLKIQQKLGIFPRIETAFFLADRAFADISSSNVKGMIGPAGWEEAIKEFIPPCMWDRFIKFVKESIKGTEKEI